MSTEAQITVSSLLMMLGNVQHENFQQMREMFAKLSQKVESLENLLIGMKEGKGCSTCINNAKNLQAYEPLNLPVGIVTSTPKKKIVKEVTGTTDKSLEIFCFDCQRRFVRGTGEFSRHVKDTACKPYKCHCGKLFKKKSSLTAHESTHSNAAYACDCGAIFRCEQYLRNHRRRKHQEDPSDYVPSSAKVPRLESSPDDDYRDTSFSLTPMDLLKLQMQEY